jgi:hypothetical protein
VGIENAFNNRHIKYEGIQKKDVQSMEVATIVSRNRIISLFIYICVTFLHYESQCDMSTK